jgi:adenylate kinase
MRKLIIINRLPGSGKGTQADLIADKFDLIHISSGQLIRDALKSSDESEFTREIKSRYEKGIVQPDEVALKLISRKINSIDQNKGVIFDSFPINLSQARLMEDIVRDNNFQKPIFIILNISPDEAVKRLSTRKICGSCGNPIIDKDGSQSVCPKCGGDLVVRSDDKEEVVRKRVDSYLPLLNDLKGYYQSKGTLIEIDGEHDINTVYELIVKALNVK